MPGRVARRADDLGEDRRPVLQVGERVPEHEILPQVLHGREVFRPVGLHEQGRSARRRAPGQKERRDHPRRIKAGNLVSRDRPRRHGKAEALDIDAGVDRRSDDVVQGDEGPGVVVAHAESPGHEAGGAEHRDGDDHGGRQPAGNAEAGRSRVPIGRRAKQHGDERNDGRQRIDAQGRRDEDGGERADEDALCGGAASRTGSAPTRRQGRPTSGRPSRARPSAGRRAAREPARERARVFRIRPRRVKRWRAISQKPRK